MISSKSGRPAGSPPVDRCALRTVALVGCSGRKLQRAAPARELYTSPLFRKSLAYAQTLTSDVFVISAQHGLVPLDHQVEPYDLELRKMTDDERAWWGLEVTNALARLFPREPLRLVILAGSLYADHLTAYDVDHRAWKFEEPLVGLEIGERLSFLNTQLRRAA